MEVKLIKFTRCGNQNPLLTVEIEMPKFIQAQFNTHRALNRNSQSSRAVPNKKLINTVPDYIPKHVGLDCKGMTPDKYLKGEDLIWFQDRWSNIKKVVQIMVKEIQAEAKERFGKTLEKGIINRPLEPFKMVRIIATGTLDEQGWLNFLNQRDHGDAQGPIRDIAKQIRSIIELNVPENNYYHLPYVDEDKPLSTYAIKYSVVSCAVVSYRNRIAYDKEDTVNRIYDKLINSKPVHWSPFEHQAFNYYSAGCSSNLNSSGLVQLRKILNYSAGNHTLENVVAAVKWVLARKLHGSL